MSPFARSAVTCCLLFAGGCLQVAPDERPPEPSPSRTPVFLISLDTVRADAVSDTDPARARTPHLARFGLDAMTFSRAYSEIPFTLPAHATMLTGVAPDAHGLFGRDDRLSENWTTLAEVLAAAGYRTAGVMGSDWLRAGFGFGRGFETYDPVVSDLTVADAVTRRGMERLDRILEKGGTPFVFLHYYDAHSDFEVDGNVRAYHASASASARLSAECRKGQCAPDGKCATGFLHWANREPTEVSLEQRQCLRASYQAGIEDLDAAFGRLMQELAARDLYDGSLIAVTSDHGEEFGEHDQFIHAQPFVETLAIPLWIKLPGGQRAGARIDRPAQLADLVPTLLAQLGLAQPTGLTGQDLLAAPDTRPRLILGQNKYRPQRYSALRGRWKLVHDFVEDRSSLFDLDRDPAEEVDVAGSHPRLVSELLEALEARRQELRAASAEHEARAGSKDEVLTPEAQRRLEALGYID